jgi:hypothetical protein
MLPTVSKLCSSLGCSVLSCAKYFKFMFLKNNLKIDFNSFQTIFKSGLLVSGILIAHAAVVDGY